MGQFPRKLRFVYIYMGRFMTQQRCGIDHFHHVIYFEYFRNISVKPVHQHGG